MRLTLIVLFASLFAISACDRTTPTVTCGSGLLLCAVDAGASSCVDPSSDVNNCGGCGHHCPVGNHCLLSTCTCLHDTFCDPSHPTTCTDSTVDNDNCGSCGNVCPTGSHCVDSTCVCTTGGGGTGKLCSSVCTDVTVDPSNCGDCGRVCPTSNCIGAKCKTTGGAELQLCAGTWVDLSNDAANCGTCGHVCTMGYPCTDGQCVFPKSLCCVLPDGPCCTSTPDPAWVCCLNSVGGNQCLNPVNCLR